MLFVAYWELNEDMPFAERLAAGGKLMESGLFPPDGVEILRWDATADGWGVLICEADSAQAMSDALGLWRASSAGFFRMTKTSPAVPVQEAMQHGGDTLDKLGSA